MTPLIENYEDRLAKITLEQGSHDSREQGMCAMEAAAYVAGEPHSDHPECVSSAITRFLIEWNDALPTDADRDLLIKPLIPHVVGTRTNDADEMRRSQMAMDWLLRECAPAFLSLTPTLRPHADALRAAREVTDDASLAEIQPLILAAKAEAAAAWAAARAAAWAAARAAARDAAWAAARDAARDAAWDAARDAARDALRPTTEALQASAVLLVRRMADVGRSS